MAEITPIARRLEVVKKAVGHGKSFRAFWRALVDEDFWQSRNATAPEVSREAARTYHLDKDPPSSYLMAVVERFDVNPSWLLMGREGEPRFMEDVRKLRAASLTETDHPLWPPALSGVPKLADWPTSARVMFLEVLGYYATSFGGAVELFFVTEDHPRRHEAIEALARDLWGMVDVKYYSMRTVSQREFTQYLIAMLHAVQLRIPDAGEGEHIFTRFPQLDPEWPAKARGLAEELKDDQTRAEWLQQALDGPLQ